MLCGSPGNHFRQMQRVTIFCLQEGLKIIVQKTAFGDGWEVSSCAKPPIGMQCRWRSV